MILRIAIFGVVLFGLVFLDRRILFPKQIVVPDIIFLGWLLGFYLILLYLEIKSKILIENSLKKVRWSGFQFTFWIGVIWWSFISFSGDYSWFIGPVRIIGLFAGLVFGGIIFGLIGMAITQFMACIIFKYRDPN